MSSGVIILINGKFEFFAICAASVVFPVFGNPTKRTEKNPVARATLIHKLPPSRISVTGVPQVIMLRFNLKFNQLFTVSDNIFVENV